MKQIKHVLGFVLAMVMTIAMSMTVMADTTTYNISVPSDDNHSYSIYQIFTGDYKEGVLSNVKWGANGTGTKGEAVDDAILQELEGTTGTDAEKLAVIKKYFDADSAAVGTATKAAPYKAAPGYYLIKDAADLSGTEDSYTIYIVKINGPVEITRKAKTPESFKKVKDTNDSVANSTTGWQDSADYDIGDTVPYKLTATLPDNVSSYTKFTLKFVDDISKGLTYVKTTKITIDGKEIALVEAAATSETSSYEGGTVYQWDLGDVKALGATDKSVVEIEYEAKLNEDAVLGSDGNPNKMHITFSNNPNWNGEGTPEEGKTPDDTVIVFTYKVVVNKTHKVDGKDQPLEGAGFKLYKKVDGEYKQIGDELVGGELTTFEFKGLDDGDYKIEESKTPGGYNTIEPIEFTITADHDVLSDNPALTKLSGDRKSGEVVTFTPDTEKGSLTTDVENKKGKTLPTTGGAGTRLIYILGAILVIGGGVLLVARKRMAA
ncbi:MAG: isopeptide-forming domain-containing fimbrial protein [Lachnospiraceae bacterium]|nr:isopeptide-forming domain-containing fimbrial protein [Lachnospiraceae bacterium]